MERGTRFIALVICLVFAFDTGLTYIGLDPQGSIETWVMLVGAFALSAACIVFNSYNYEKDWRVTGIVIGLTFVIAFINYNAFMRKHTEADASRKARTNLESQLYSLEQINDCQNDIIWRGGERVKARCTSDDMRNHNADIKAALSLIPTDLPAAPTIGERAFRIGLALFLPLLHIAGGLLLRQKVQITGVSVPGSDLDQTDVPSDKVHVPGNVPERPRSTVTNDKKGRPIPELGNDVRRILREEYLKLTENGAKKITKTAFHSHIKQFDLPGCGHKSSISNWIDNDSPVVRNVHEIKMIRPAAGGKTV